ARRHREADQSGERRTSHGSPSPMKKLATVLAALVVVGVSAATLQPANIIIKTDPAVTVKVNRLRGNTSKTISITVNQQDVVIVNPAPIPPMPPNMHGGLPVDQSTIPAPQAGVSDVRVTDSQTFPPVSAEYPK